MSYSGRGNSGDVLKVNVQQQSIFGPISVPVTVASGTVLSPDYNTVAAALSAGAKDIRIIGDTFETTDLNITDAANILIESDSLWDLQDNTFYGSEQADIAGNGRLRYRKAVFEQPTFISRVIILDFDIINDSVNFSPLISSNRSRVTNCLFEGDCVLRGSGVLVNGCEVRGNLVVMAGASGVNVQQSHIINGLTIDSGNNTVLSNIKFN